MAALTVKSGDAFNLGKMSRDQRTLRNDFYGRRGFIFVDIAPSHGFWKSPVELDLIFRITEGDVYRAPVKFMFTLTAIPAIRSTMLSQMLSEFAGEIIDFGQLEDSERRLKATQLFDNEGQGPRVEEWPSETATPAIFTDLILFCALPTNRTT